MRATYFLLSCGLAAVAVLGAPTAENGFDYRVKESSLVPRGWQIRGRAPAGETMVLHIGLKQGNFEELERQLYEGACAKKLFIEKRLGFFPVQMSTITAACLVT